MKKILIILSIFLLNSSSKEIEYCDIKGNVKNPGVYEIKDNYTIQDVIKAAGGLKKNSYTENINLSKKVSDEMVIYIFNNEEINSYMNIEVCNCEPVYKYIECDEAEEIIENTPIIKEEPITTTIIPPEETTTITTTTMPTTQKQEKININLCNKEDLLTINGLGDKKAEAIINYRLEVGLFKTIEDIMNVNGIGESTFEKIKDFIEV